MNRDLEASPAAVDPHALHYQEILFSLAMSVVAMLGRDNPLVRFPDILWAFAAMLGFNLVYHRLLRSRGGLLVPLISMSVNVALCSLILGLSGGDRSSFWPLYLLPIFTACLHLQRRHVMGVCAAAGAFLACFYLEAFWDGRRWEACEFLIKLGVLGFSAAVTSQLSFKERAQRLDIAAGRAHIGALDRSLERRTAALIESETQLLQSQKMEALGRLSGGVAHDFNNILTAITGYSELALLNPKLEEGLRADIQEILAAASRAAILTRQLLAFSRRQIFSPKILDLNCTLVELHRMLQRIIGEDIKLTGVPSADLLHVQVDADQIGQVILNLVVNARDAMPKGGTLVLSTANVELGKADLHAQPDIQPGRFVRLSVEDSGAGMDAATMSRIFEPFFTTKSKDKGTGLGLATVYGIIKQSNGFIEVDSRPGAGSAFHIYLPAVDGDLDAVLKSPALEPLKGAETILVVDDDPAVGLIARRILERQGYTIIEARDGEEALRRCGGLEKPPDMLLTDVVMPGLSGPELARRLKAERPACKILFISGYADAGVAELTAMKGHFLSKPFVAANLIKKVREILDSSEACAA